MNKAELVQKLMEKAGGCSKAEAERYLDGLVEIITASLKAGEEVSIPGLGSFSVKTRAARTGVNPKTGEKIQIPSMKRPKFKAAKPLKDALK